MTFFDDLFKKENIAARIISLLVACGLWVYVMTEQNPVVERYYTIPLEKQNLDENVEAFGMPASVNVQVRASRMVLDDKNKRDIKAYVNFAGTSVGNYKLPINIEFKNGEVLSINPKEVHVNIDTIKERELPVTIRVVDNHDEDLTIRNEGAEIGRAVIKGTSSSLESVASVIAPIDITNHRENFTTESRLMAVDANNIGVDDIRIVPETMETEVTIVRKLLTIDLPVKVSYMGDLPEGMDVADITYEPQTITVTASPSVLKNVKQLHTLPVDISKIVQGEKIVTNVVLPNKVIAANKVIHVYLNSER